MQRTLTTVFLVLLATALLATTAKAAPTAGQDPAAAYLAFHSALKRSFSERGIWPYYHSEARAEFEERFAPEVRSRVFFMMKNAAPHEVIVERTEVEGARATLTLRPTDPSNRTVGTARMAQEDGVWKVVEVFWQQS